MRKFLKNKKGAEMTIGTIIIIILALIVLVVLIVGFTSGWSNLWDRITGLFSPVNIDARVQDCKTYCLTNSAYDFCQRKITVKSDEAIFKVTNGEIGGSGEAASEGKATCKYLANNHGSLGFEDCGTVDCAPNNENTGGNGVELPNTKKLCSEIAGAGWVDGSVCAASISKMDQVTDADKGEHQNQICCGPTE